ncbi:YdgA family protein [Nocardioides sp. B-3]|uniref:YdgA family protein n=1 Tax=Nocardioides sp. B-3 TaxID=2895565 RepID=UPI0021527C69|nr:YdgA family protein [Nocardioides sp. B-3]UUZ57667.1 YdgA family protein [Nocardioides sp. B-3]
MTPMPVASVRRRVALTLVAALVLFAVAVAVPLGWTWWQGNQARASLEKALVALQDEDVDEARGHVEDARAYADRGVATRHGVVGTLWRNLPILAPAADDAVRMADAVDDLTAVAEEGIAIYPAAHRRRGPPGHQRQGRPGHAHRRPRLLR